MNASFRRIAPICAAASLAGALHAPAALAQAMPPTESGRGPHPRLDGIELSEAQQDRLFAITHAAEELLRVRTDAQVMSLLTPQLREELQAERGPRGPRG